jgi:hypothetical protein
MKKTCRNILLRQVLQVGVTGFEPATFCTPCRRASQVTLHPVVQPDLRVARGGRGNGSCKDSISEEAGFDNAEKKATFRGVWR